MFSDSQKVEKRNGEQRTGETNRKESKMVHLNSAMSISTLIISDLSQKSAVWKCFISTLSKTCVYPLVIHSH